MTSVVLQPHTRGADGVGLSTLHDFSKVRAAGYQWVSLYLGGQYGVKPFAIEAAWAAGLPVMLNYERLASDAKNGYPAGQRAAQTALGQAQALGFHGEAPLPFSAADEHFADLAGAGLDYHRALVDVLQPEGWVGGAYGFREMLALIAQQSWWPDDWPLWHWGGDGSTIYPWTWVKQGPGGSYYDSTIGMNVDRNTLYKPMPFWSGYGADKIEPVEEDDVTPEEHGWLAHVYDQLSASGPVKGPDGNPLTMYWATQQIADQTLHRAWLDMARIANIADAVAAKLPTAEDRAKAVAAIAAAVVAALPEGSGGGVTAEELADELARRLTHDA